MHSATAAGAPWLLQEALACLAAAKGLEAGQGPKQLFYGDNRTGKLGGWAAGRACACAWWLHPACHVF